MKKEEEDNILRKFGFEELNLLHLELTLDLLDLLFLINLKIK